MHEARAFAFRQRATQAYQKAMRPNIPDETRRAWLIIEREWIKMAEREEAKLNDPARAASPGGKAIGPAQQTSAGIVGGVGGSNRRDKVGQRSSVKAKRLEFRLEAVSSQLLKRSKSRLTDRHSL